MASSFTLLVFADTGGVIASESFGHWVDTREAIDTTRQEYPNAIALMDRATGAILWDRTGNLY
jgi:hypothetical protein